MDFKLTLARRLGTGLEYTCTPHRFNFSHQFTKTNFTVGDDDASVPSTYRRDYNWGVARGVRSKGDSGILKNSKSSSPNKERQSVKFSTPTSSDESLSSGENPVDTNEATHKQSSGDRQEDPSSTCSSRKLQKEKRIALGKTNFTLGDEDGEPLRTVYHDYAINHDYRRRQKPCVPPRCARVRHFTL